MFKFARVGRSSRTDIAVGYMYGRVNEKDVKKVMDSINSMDVDALTMNQESLAETGDGFQPSGPCQMVDGRLSERF